MKKVGLVGIPDALVHLQTRGVGGTLRAQGEKGSCWMNLKCIYGFQFFMELKIQSSTAKITLWFQLQEPVLLKNWTFSIP